MSEQEIRQWQKLTNENIETAIELLKENVRLKKIIRQLDDTICDLQQQLEEYQTNRRIIQADYEKEER